MTVKTILLADNHVEFLDTRVEFLERAGYSVVKARSPEETRERLEDTWVHILILDIRLRDDQDEEDTTGLELAQDPRYQRIPKIILTNYPSYDYVRTAMRRQPETQTPPAVDFLSKEEGPLAMIQAVEQTFSRHVPINWGLFINLSARCAYSLAGLVRLLHPGLDSAQEALHSAELEDLLRRLFTQSQQITIDRLMWQKSDRLALIIFAYASGALAQQFLVTCGKIEVIRVEIENLDHMNPSLRHHVQRTMHTETLHYGANCYELEGSDLETVKPFEDFFKQSSPKEINICLQNLLEPGIAVWQQNRRIARENERTDNLFKSRLGIENLLVEDLEARITHLGSEAAQAGLAKVSLTIDRLIFYMPSGDGLIYSYPNPIPWIVGADRGYPWPLTLIGTTVGELDVNTILVEAAKSSWLTDFGYVREGPVAGDFTALETIIKFDLVDHTNLEDIQELEHILLAVKRLNQRVESGPPQYKKAMSAVLKLRRLASELGEHTIEPYYWGLLFYATKRLLTYSPGVRRTRSELMSFLHACLCTGLIAEHLEQATHQQDELTGGGLSGVVVNTAQHEVQVNGKVIELTPTEFKIMLLLWKNRGQLCSRQDIFESLNEQRYSFDKNMGHDDYVNVHMQRLRGKLEMDPGNPKYIVTRRGYGYILYPTGKKP